MIYEFKSVAGLEGPDGTVYEDGDIYFELNRPIGKAESIGKKIKCPVEGFSGQIERVSSSPNFSINGKAQQNWVEGQKASMVDKNGEQVDMTFIDHRKSLPDLARSVVQGQSATSMPARFDPKSGRTVIDVASNVKDPFGKLSGNAAERVVKQVNTPYKKRSNGK